MLAASILTWTFEALGLAASYTMSPSKVLKRPDTLLNMCRIEKPTWECAGSILKVWGEASAAAGSTPAARMRERGRKRAFMIGPPWEVRVSLRSNCLLQHISDARAHSGVA